MNKLYVVGIGPGNNANMTVAASKAIAISEVIVGYSTYVGLIKELITDKEIIQTGMTHEIERAQNAIETASSGKITSIVSSGDPGIYAMAGLVYELSKTMNADIEIEVIPGIPSLSFCAAKLGAPLMHDFAAISLSDRLTPWGIIEKRLDATALADFVIVLYNPKSKGRKDNLNKAVDIILRHRDKGTPTGIVRSAYRDEESVIVTTIDTIPYDVVDMQTTIIIGNSKTVNLDGLMVTPRGYGDRYDYEDSIRNGRVKKR